MTVRKAVIPAAGFGTRFLPVTKAVPKELLPIVDRPTIQYIVEEAVAAGVRQVVFVLSRGKEAVADHFDVSAELEAELRRKGKAALADEISRLSSLVEVFSVRQKQIRGLGDAVLSARAFVGEEPFVVLLGDDLVDAEVPCTRQMAEVHERTGRGVVAVMEVPPEDVSLYGIVDGEDAGERCIEVRTIVEKPRPGTLRSRLAIIGRYLLPPSIFPILERTPPGVGGEIQLTDALAELARTEGLVAYRFEGLRFDAGDRLGYLQANLHYALRRPDLEDRLRAYLRTLLASARTTGLGRETA